jgi:hypothetical protein
MSPLLSGPHSVMLMQIAGRMALVKKLLLFWLGGQPLQELTVTRHAQLWALPNRFSQCWVAGSVNVGRNVCQWWSGGRRCSARWKMAMVVPTPVSLPTHSLEASQIVYCD